MRIALLALHFAEYASRLAVALAARHQVLLLLQADNAQRELTDDLRSELARTVQVHYLRLPRLRDPRMLFTGAGMNRIIRAFAPDLMHAQECHALLNGYTLLSLRAAMPIVMTVHDPCGHGDGTWWHQVPWKVQTLLRRTATRVIVHGPRMASELQALDARWADRIDAIPHGLLGSPEASQDGDAHEPGTFLFFGRMVDYKGLRYLLDATDLLHGRGQPVRLVLGGTGEDLERHRARIAARSWIELIDRYVEPAEVTRLFHRATAVVLPYTGATQSGVAAMALANRCPVVATKLGDLPEVVIPGVTGLLVPPRDATALAGAMERLLLDAGLRATLAAGAGRYAAERLSWAHIAELTEGSYRRALEQQDARARGSQAGRAATADQHSSR